MRTCHRAARSLHDDLSSPLIITTPEEIQMPTRSRHLVFAALAVALSGGYATRAAATCGKVSDSRLNTFIQLLAPPPCDDCDETKAELKS